MILRDGRMVSSPTRGTPPLLTVRTRACPSQQDGYPLPSFAEGKALSQLPTGRQGGTVAGYYCRQDQPTLIHNPDLRWRPGWRAYAAARIPCPGSCEARMPEAALAITLSARAILRSRGATTQRWASSFVSPSHTRTAREHSARTPCAFP